MEIAYISTMDPADVDPHLCTHIIYAFGKINYTTHEVSDYLVPVRGQISGFCNCLSNTYYAIITIFRLNNIAFYSSCKRDTKDCGSQENQQRPQSSFLHRRMEL